MEIPVKLEAFEGPLDLLLHLIDKNKVSIYDIPIVEITDQYLEYLSGAEEKDLDSMSEFLVMAATLIRIKSKMLLPKEEEETEEDIDPRDELVNRLLEYKMFKFISEELKDKQFDAAKMMYKEPSIPAEIADYEEEVDVSELLSGLTLSKLHNIFDFILKRQKDKVDPIRSTFGKIEREEVTLSNQLTHIQEYGLRNRRFRFSNLFTGRVTKMEVIVTFLGILELMKIGRVEIKQVELFDDIEIHYLADDVIQLEEDGF